MFSEEQHKNEARPVFRMVSSAGEAEEHLRVIRQAMERSTRHSTLSGLSGVIVGLLAFGGCLVTAAMGRSASTPESRLKFVIVWVAVLALSLLTDYVLTKRRAARFGKTAFSPLGKHLARAAAPGFLTGCALCMFYLTHPSLLDTYLYGIWMLCYATSLLAVGMFSVREVGYLGWAFMIAGAFTLLVPIGTFPGPRSMMAVTFGGFHVLYGIWMGWKYGW